MRLASWVSVFACLSLAACNDDEPPLPDSGMDSGRDVALILDGAPTDVSVDMTLADAGDSGVLHDAAKTLDGAKGDGAAGDGTAGDSAKGDGPGVNLDGGADVILSLVCGSAGQACCDGGCGTGARCASNTCEPCGGPGEACCITATACSDAGCCDNGVCTPAGSACPGNGGLCKSSSCGGACPDGGCGACGAAGQACCANIGCTASLELVCDTDGGRNVCAVCGSAGTPCCPAASGVQCAGSGNVCSTSGTCVACGGAGQPACQ
jgi:hypothetical protein